jgi:flavin reductase (DIM6/NTAB) family NADH-FMN oxidoreductase RutF
MQPPMVLICLDRGSELLAVIRSSRQFGVNVLGREQSALALKFARKGGAGKFAGVPWTSDGGVPRIPGAGGFLACSGVQLVDGGDHVILLGSVLAAHTDRSRPLTYHDRAFGTHVPLD